MFIPLYDDNPYDPLFYPYVTRLLVVANVAVFVLFQSPLLLPDPASTVLTFGVTPAAFTVPVDGDSVVIPVELTFITYMFLHGGWLHLIGNMLFLWVFGDNVEHAMGRLRFLLFYVACGVAGGGAHYLSAPDSTAPLIGASAAIAGVVAAYLMLFPHAKVWVLLFMRIPLKLAAKWVLAEPDSDLALELYYANVLDGVSAPPFLLIEVTNAIWRRVPGGTLLFDTALGALDEFLSFEVASLAPPELYRRAMRLTNQFERPNVYDMHYVALAEIAGCDLWTADKRLLNTVAGRLPFVRDLAEFRA